MNKKKYERDNFKKFYSITFIVNFFCFKAIGRETFSVRKAAEAPSAQKWCGEEGF